MRIRIALIMQLAGLGLAFSQWTVVNLHPAGASTSVINAVEGSSQAGYVLTSSFNYACVWQGSAQTAISFNPFGATNGVIHTMRDGKQGGIVHSQATLWFGAPNNYVSLHPTGASVSLVQAIDGDFQVGSASFSSGIWRASLWQGAAQSWINLHPANQNVISSWGSGGRNGQQVGYVRFTINSDRASIWQGSASTWRDIHPSGASRSYALDTDGSLQVGYAYFGNYEQAGYWRGTRNSWINLHPANYSISRATSTHRGWIAGYVASNYGSEIACVWNSADNSVQYLHGVLPSGYHASQATSIWSDGRRLLVGGLARNSALNRWEAILWMKNLSLPGDVNGDNCVNDIDLLRVLFAFGQSGGAEDLDGNGVVGDNDLLIVLFNFGNGC